MAEAGLGGREGGGLCGKEVERRIEAGLEADDRASRTVSATVMENRLTRLTSESTGRCLTTFPSMKTKSWTNLMKSSMTCRMLTRMNSNCRLTMMTVVMRGVRSWRSTEFLEGRSKGLLPQPDS